MFVHSGNPVYIIQRCFNIVSIGQVGRAAILTTSPEVPSVIFWILCQGLPSTYGRLMHQMHSRPSSDLRRSASDAGFPVAELSAVAVLPIARSFGSPNTLKSAINGHCTAWQTGYRNSGIPGVRSKVIALNLRRIGISRSCQPALTCSWCYPLRFQSCTDRLRCSLPNSPEYRP